MATAGTLRVTVTAKTRKYIAGMKRAERQTSKFRKKMVSLGKVMAATFSVAAVIQFARKSVELFRRQEEAIAKLTGSLQLLGDVSNEAMTRMRAFAASIQKVTVIGDEAVLELMAMGAGIGRLKGEALEEATKAAIGLSRRLGIDLVAAMRLVARAAVGDTAQLKRYGIVISELLSAQEKFAQVQTLGRKGFLIAMKEAETTSGQIKQHWNVIGDKMEVIGGFLGKYLLAPTMGGAGLLLGGDPRDIFGVPPSETLRKLEELRSWQDLLRGYKEELQGEEMGAFIDQASQLPGRYGTLRSLRDPKVAKADDDKRRRRAAAIAAARKREAAFYLSLTIEAESQRISQITDTHQRMLAEVKFYWAERLRIEGTESKRVRALLQQMADADVRLVIGRVAAEAAKIIDMAGLGWLRRPGQVGLSAAEIAAFAGQRQAPSEFAVVGGRGVDLKHLETMGRRDPVVQANVDTKEAIEQQTKDFKAFMDSGLL